LAAIIELPGVLARKDNGRSNARAQALALRVLADGLGHNETTREFNISFAAACTVVFTAKAGKFLLDC
jgi:hypothetical protein